MRALSELACGESGEIVRLECNRRAGVRQMELGVLPGVQVEVVRKAPLQDPIELRLRGYALSIRRSEAESIWVSDPPGAEVPG